MTLEEKYELALNALTRAYWDMTEGNIHMVDNVMQALDQLKDDLDSTDVENILC